MRVRFDGQRLRGGREARERFYDSRGYGRPRDGQLELAPVEVAHLLFRGDLESVARDGRSLDFADLLASAAVPEVAFLVYKDLRDRGFYLSPARDTVDAGVGEFVVYPRGQGPWDEAVAYRMLAVSEREDIPVGALQELVERAAADNATAVLAVVDEESEVTYLEMGDPTIGGATDHALPAVQGRLLSDRVLVPDPPASLYSRAFYGQQLGDQLQLSLVEAVHLAETDRLTLAGDGPAGDRLRERGRAVEGDRFDRRRRVYSALRGRGLVPKTGFKFGADFRTYADVDSVDELGHSELLVRVLDAGHVFAPRDLALDVRLAHGVRKRVVFALVGDDINWLAVERLTP